MAYKITQWEFSNGENYDAVDPEAGYRMLKIMNASCTKDDLSREIYNITCLDLQNNAEFDLRFFLTSISDNMVRTEDRKQRSMVQSLGRSLFGPEFTGLPYPSDIIGGIVGAEITLKESSSGRMYPRTYHFDPVPMDWAMMADIEQYYYDENSETGAGDGDVE